ncbi:hypothetical protein CVT26_015415 [Gymnopilus dilepis]|uniref:Uncharacterized protein n=1 Tax=Gymnopilus dilepis TaxID=231916 RepID=A0A409YEC7_9AGAR|nr:hypothetical protein CVT26_015415 [Gymnopilus dilepis]
MSLEEERSVSEAHTFQSPFQALTITPSVCTRAPVKIALDVDYVPSVKSTQAVNIAIQKICGIATHMYEGKSSHHHFVNDLGQLVAQLDSHTGPKMITGLLSSVVTTPSPVSIVPALLILTSHPFPIVPNNVLAPAAIDALAQDFRLEYQQRANFHLFMKLGMA